ncbi:putative ribonuclease H-like domain-containing protein [Tanacetum coccineum]
MEQYLTFTDHALWEVIVNGDSVSPIASASAGVEGPIPPKTAEQKLARKNEQNQIGLDKTYDRFQKLISQLEIHEEVISQEDANLKLLRNNSSSTNETVNTAYSVSAASSKDQASIASYANDVMFSIGGYDWSFQAEEGITNFALMAYTSQGSSSSDSEYDVQVKDISIKDFKNQVEEALKEKDDLKLKLEKFEESSKNLTKLINSQISANDKTSLGYDSQINEGEVVHSVFNSKEIDVDDSPVNDRFKTGEGFHAVPPPYTRNYMPSRPDLSFVGLDNSIYKTKVSKTKTSISKTCKDIIEKPKTLRPNAPIIEEWDTDSDNDSVFRPKSDQTKPKFTKLILSNLKSSPRAATSISTARHVNTAAPKPKVNDALPTPYSYFKVHSPVRRAFNQTPAAKTNNFNEKVNNFRVNNVTTAGPKAVVSTAEGNRENAVKSSACWIWRPIGNVNDHTSKDSGPYMLKIFNYVDLQGRLKHMIGNKSFLIDYQEIDGRFVTFGESLKGGKITGKGKIRTGKLDFKDVYFVKELKFNLFSVSQMCDKKNSVLFTETECLVLSPDFKLLDESQVLLKVPRQNNMYSFDLKNVVPSGGLTCLFAKATIDESNLWHRRLGHINFKTMNKLVRGNLVRGLPSKLFENDHTCVACQKGKQHKASCKTKLVSSISQPLQMLHMDLFGPTSVRSINHKTYCLVVTDDFSRFSWVFFLATKDETSGILKTFITGIENQINHKVKIIRCDNGTEFKNNDMNQFCGMKGIKREFSVARTPQQNGVAERKNRTLIEAARTMLADSLLPTTFWAKVVNTACYVQNRVLVTKPHNKTPYELLHGRPPSISFMRPFGCPVTILNTLDPLGKFDGKADEGFLVGYSINSKAFRVFNTRTRKVEENLHITFLENKPNVAGSGPDWLFDIDLLTNSMNYEPVTAGNQTNKNACIKDNVNAVHTQQYILLPLLYDSPHSLEDAVADDAGKKTNEKPANKGERNGQEEEGGASNKEGDQNVQDFRASISVAGQSLDNADDLLTDSLMPDLEDTTNLLNTGIFNGAYDNEDEGAEADLNSLETTKNVSLIPTTRIYKDHPKDQIIRDMNPATQTRRMTKISEEHVVVSYIYKQRRTNHKDYQTYLFAYFLSQKELQKVIQALDDPSWIKPIQDELLQFRLQKVWRLVDLSKGKHAIRTKWVYRNKKDKRGIVDRSNQDKGDILLVQVYVDDIIFGSTEKSLCVEFEQMMHKRFQMSFMGELTFFLGLQVNQKDDGIFISQDKCVADILKKFDFATVKTASTPIEINKALLKDEEAEDVDVHLYRSMIGSLMYLIASRPDIMFAVCACARFQVTPKVSHLHAVKRIFRYLKGQPKLGLWYPRDSPFDLEAFSDSDYAGASLDRKSTTGEYVAAANCCGQVLWIQNQMLDYGFNFMNTKIHIDNESTICIVKNPVFHAKTKHIEIRHHFIRDSYKKRLIQVIKIHTDHNVVDLLTKAFDAKNIEYMKRVKSQTPRQAKRGRDTKIPQSGGPPEKVGDEAVHKELGDRMERAATTASSSRSTSRTMGLLNRTKSMTTLN